MAIDLLAGGVVLTAVLWTLLPLLRHDAWWIRAFEFPRVQVTFLTALVVIVYIGLAGWRAPQDWLLIGLLAVCIIFQLLRIGRYTPLHRKQVGNAAEPQSEDRLSLLVANVLTPNRSAEALLKLIRQRDPDIVLAVETDEWWESKLDALEPDYPYRVKHPRDNLYGMHLYSRLELLEPQISFLVEDDVPSIHADAVLRSGHRVKLHCLHPAPPSPTENPTSAERDAELLVVAKAIDTSEQSVVVLGDLNDVAWSETTQLFQNTSGLLDPRIGRGIFATFNAKYPFLRWPLDHVFCSPDFTLVSLERLAYFGSDHFPIGVVLSHTPAAKAVHDRPQPSADEEKWAEEKIDKVDTNEDAISSGEDRILSQKGFSVIQQRPMIRA